MKGAKMRKGSKHTKETRAKMRAFATGNSRSAETRAKMSKSKKEYYKTNPRETSENREVRYREWDTEHENKHLAGMGRWQPDRYIDRRDALIKYFRAGQRRTNWGDIDRWEILSKCLEEIEGGGVRIDEV